MYSGPSCLSNRLCSVAISCAVYSLMRVGSSWNGLLIALCWSPGLNCFLAAVTSKRLIYIRRHGRSTPNAMICLLEGSRQCVLSFISRSSPGRAGGRAESDAIESGNAGLPRSHVRFSRAQTLLSNLLSMFFARIKIVSSVLVTSTRK